MLVSGGRELVVRAPKQRMLPSCWNGFDLWTKIDENMQPYLALSLALYFFLPVCPSHLESQSLKRAIMASQELNRLPSQSSFYFSSAEPNQQRTCVSVSSVRSRFPLASPRAKAATLQLYIEQTGLANFRKIPEECARMLEPEQKKPSWGWVSPLSSLPSSEQ